MTQLVRSQNDISELEEKLYMKLDKGIDDMEQGRVVSHDEAMKQIRERIESYAL